MRSNQFQAAAAYNRTTRDLWVCYYDTRGDPRRVKTRFTCAVAYPFWTDSRRLPALGEEIYTTTLGATRSSPL